MLKNIPRDFTPLMMTKLMEMGHGEQLLICDANFPYLSMNKETIITTAMSIEKLLDEILYFFPLDQSVSSSAIVMENAKKGAVFQKYEDVIRRSDSTVLTCLERFEFYKQARRVAAIIYTSDTAPCANIILQKGVVN